MIPELHPCSRCKKEPVWTDCLPALCHRCAAERLRHSCAVCGKFIPVPSGDTAPYCHVDGGRFTCLNCGPYDGADVPVLVRDQP